ncbi:hypothetical protein L1049_017520 [Liquidambar formosana]|uniref:RNase H type-1 domain-containing protein n=1 Tax=Liquidambar formosana TaxID=63359 RepID=A0AAP0S3F0_LIQFO
MARDDGGNILAATSKRVQGAFTLLHIEAMCMRFALGFIQDLDLEAIILEGDNAEVVNALKVREISLASVGLLIEDIKLEEVKDKASPGNISMIDVTHIRYFKVLGKGVPPSQRVVVKVELVKLASKNAEKKIKEVGGAVVLTA